MHSFMNIYEIFNGYIYINGLQTCTSYNELFLRYDYLINVLIVFGYDIKPSIFTFMAIIL